jgi:hypothetical protein
MMMLSVMTVVLGFILTFGLVQIGEAMHGKQLAAAGHQDQTDHAGNYNIRVTKL